MITVSALFGSFITYYVGEQNTKAKIIATNFHQVMHETSYNISTELNNLNNLNNFKALLDRKAAQNHLISALVIARGKQILLTTDHSIRKLPKHIHHHTQHQSVNRHFILDNSVHELEFEVYQQNKPIQLSLLLFANQPEIKNYFADTYYQYFVFFIIPTLLVFLFLHQLLKKFLVKPLEKLRLFAYYHDRTPQPLKIKELETIRSSMLQTFQLLSSEKQALYRSSRTDALSELPNRYQLNERLEWLIEESKRTNTPFAYLFLDIDNFKKINDTLGHDAGDEIVVNVAKIMQEALRAYDIIARVGGDEFVIILSKYQNLIELNHIIDRVLLKISQEQIVSNQSINVSASIGVAFYPKDGTDGQELMKSADIAMYEAKKQGRNQHHYFTEELNQRIQIEVNLEKELHLALKNNEFELYYQPKVSSKTKNIIGIECLVRWNHPEKGLVPPGEFITIAEQSGLILPLGDWILKEAIENQLHWQQQYNIQLPVSVNVSALQFSHKDFFNKLETLVNELNFPANFLDIEITESVLMENTQEHLNTLKKIRGLGATISLDDFGTGYSSLAYLKIFPINILKIDKSFLDDYDSKSGAIFIETIVNMAHNLKIDVIAESVETEDQLNFLKQINCEAYQGYLCSKPLPEKEFIELVKNSLSTQA